MNYFEHYNTISFSLFDINFNTVFNDTFLNERWFKNIPEPHYHTMWEIYFVQKGWIEAEFHGEIKRYAENTITVIPPSTEHCIVRINENAVYSSMRFSYSKINDNSVSSNIDTVLMSNAFCPISASNELMEVLNRLKEQYTAYVSATQKKLWLYQKITASCHHLITEILEAMFDEESISNATFAKSNDTMAMIIEFLMMYNSDRNLTVSELAKNLNYSVSQTGRIIQQSFGKSFKQLNKEIRVKRSKYFLENTDFSIQKISDILGFGEIKSFNRFFKEAEGTTPAQYRKYLRCVRETKNKK